jgi:hypothetical protein
VAALKEQTAAQRREAEEAADQRNLAQMNLLQVSSTPSTRNPNPKT